MAQTHYFILTSDGRVGGGSRLPLSAERIAGAVPQLVLEGMRGWVVLMSNTITGKKITVRLIAPITGGGDFDAAVDALRAARPRQTITVVA